MGKNVPKKLNLALQGGGSHGAFTWGSLTRLLEDERIDIQAVSGTSAGAINGALMVYGHAVGGREGAIELLEEFWKRISKITNYLPFRPTPLDNAIQNRGLDYNPWYHSMRLVTRVLSPYHFNPLNINPLRNLLEDVIDFEIFKQKPAIRLFICATKLNNSSLRIFHDREINIDVLMATTCLPNNFQAVEINGEYYWDGGYLGNPAFAFLPHVTKCKDLLFILLDPIHLKAPPKNSHDINNHITTLAFNASLLTDIRAEIRIRQFASWHGIEMPTNYYFHIVEAQDYAMHYGQSSKYNTDWEFLKELFKLGYEDTGKWLEDNFEKIGKTSSVDLDELGVTVDWSWLDDQCQD